MQDGTVEDEPIALDPNAIINALRGKYEASQFRALQLEVALLDEKAKNARYEAELVLLRPKETVDDDTGPA